MLLSLDYDRTYTEDPALWGRFILMALDAGHEIICITMRSVEFTWPGEPKIPVYCTKGQAKVAWAKEAKLLVDIWIDDQPSKLLFGASG